VGGCPTDYAVDAVLGIIDVTIFLGDFWKWDGDGGVMREIPRIVTDRMK